MELRCPDPACNPYLTFAALLQAGLEGIEKGYELPEPMEKNLYHLSGEERRRLGVEQLPESLGEAIELTAESELVLRTLGEHMFNRYVEIKRQEWDDYRVQVTQWELDRYLSILCRRRPGPAQAIGRGGARGASASPAAGGRTPSGGAGRSRAAARATETRVALVVASPVSWARRSRPSAALEAPAGIGVSSRSLRRAISASPSAAVEKKPPSLGVGEAGDHLVGERRGLVEPALLAGGFEQHDQRLQQEGVVLEVGADLAPGRRCRCAAAVRGRRACSRRRTRRRRRAASR